MAKAAKGQALVIVESPTKARTITKFLGGDYIVKASNGHIRDLPNSAAEIPPEIKKEAWARLGVNIDDDFSPLYVIPGSKKAQVKDLKDALKKVDRIYLATDEDREGESISWHLVEVLKPRLPIHRLVFHEITKGAIQHALDSPREIDQNLVQAQETRRVVDRLFGYEVSPLLWKKMLPRLSAGRVQSVAVRLLVERERARISFKKATYWGLKGVFAKLDGGTPPDFEAELTHIKDKRAAIGKDFDPNNGQLKEPGEVVLVDEKTARELREQVLRSKPVVHSVEEKPYSTAPAPPFVTSTLQQEANRRLRFSARHTMSVAQQLYENGFITYMRTDSTTLSEEALKGARDVISKDFGAKYLPQEPRQYATKVRNAQEAHEAIRPAGESFTPPSAVEKQLGAEAAWLYDMIWKRTVASQMENARGTNITVRVDAGDARFRVSGKTIEFAGFQRVYAAELSELGQRSSDPSYEERLLPKLAAGEELKSSAIEALERTTQPPARYTEGSLIRELERLGIGRPSTWATIVDLVLSRSYAFKKGTALVPTFVAIGVVGLLEKFFTNLVNYAFTARLEDDLDAISRGEAERLSYLKEFYYGNGHPGLHALVKEGESAIDPREVCGLPLGTTGEGEAIEVRIGRYGPFLTNGTQRASLPDALPPDELTVEVAQKLIETATQEPEALGTDRESGLPVYLKNGRYGPYVQLGDASADDGKPKMASLLPNMDPKDVNLEQALKLLSLPRTIGEHPDDKEPVLAANGRFGPYVKWGKEIRSIPADQASPLDITLEQAVELLKQPKGKRQTAKPKTLREMGKHPVTERPLTVLSGRYGPYVSDGEINASLHRGMTPEGITIDDAVNLLEARAARIAEGGGPKFAKKKVARKGKASAKAKKSS